MRKLLVSIVILLLLISTSCLSTIYYPIKVCEKEGVNNGLGLNVLYSNPHGEMSSKPLVLSGAYSRLGLGGGFDIGTEIGSVFLVPVYLMGGVRKQFILNTDRDMGIVFDGNIGISYRIPVYRIGIGYFIENFGIYAAIHKSYLSVGSLPDIDVGSLSAISLRINYNNDYTKKWQPFIQIFYSTGNDTYDPYFHYLDFFSASVVKTVSVGAGISVNFFKQW